MNDSYDRETGEVFTEREREPREATLARLPPPSPPEFGGLDLMTVLEKRAKVMERILDYAIKSTHEEQWFDLSGKPWPGGPACEAMARRCGVSVTNLRKSKRRSSDDKGDFYIYEVEATFTLPSGFDVIEAFGTCSSRDNFLGTETGASRELSQIDEGSIMKAAYTNALVNGITRLLGVRSLSWERLKALGIDREKLGKIEFESGAKGGGQKATGSAIEIKFGKGKGKTVGAQTDEDLAWYATAFEKDLGDPAKEKWKKNTEKQLAAVKEEQAKRANAKAGTTAKPATGPKVWDRLQQIAKTAGMPIDRLKVLVKAHLQKDRVDPAQLTEEDLKAVAEKINAEKAATKAEAF